MRTSEEVKPTTNLFGRLLRLLPMAHSVNGPYRGYKWSRNLQRSVPHPGWTFCDFRNEHLFRATDYGEILKYIADNDLETADFEVHAVGNAYVPHVQLTVRHFHKDRD